MLPKPMGCLSSPLPPRRAPELLSTQTRRWYGRLPPRVVRGCWRRCSAQNVVDSSSPSSSPAPTTISGGHAVTVIVNSPGHGTLRLHLDPARYGRCYRSVASTVPSIGRTPPRAGTAASTRHDPGQSSRSRGKAAATDPSGLASSPLPEVSAKAQDSSEEKESAAAVAPAEPRPKSQFHPCTDKYGADVGSKLWPPLSARERKRGRLYVYRQQQDQGFQGRVKIGFTSQPVEQRLRRWALRCGGDPVLVHSTAEIPCAMRAEALVHQELGCERLLEVGCQGCGQNHKEWFAVREDTAVKVIDGWALIMDTLYGGEDGRMDAGWAATIAALQRESPGVFVTAEKLLRLHARRTEDETVRCDEGGDPGQFSEAVALVEEPRPPVPKSPKSPKEPGPPVSESLTRIMPMLSRAKHSDDLPPVSKTLYELHQESSNEAGTRETKRSPLTDAQLLLSPPDTARLAPTLQAQLPSSAKSSKDTPSRPGGTAQPTETETPGSSTHGNRKEDGADTRRSARHGDTVKQRKVANLKRSKAASTGEQDGSGQGTTMSPRRSRHRRAADGGGSVEETGSRRWRPMWAYVAGIGSVSVVLGLYLPAHPRAARKGLVAER
ncbi:meiotically up-regulated gene 113-domain-containing protein [Microdochium bolleyi]|uniref:Meiotically up-regulated gene 113-domain-containing protein n=1 Tax=Microdochium bolleyi TaxID=196109 RepID=A0A136IM81_9PEZI|nr:meiotically up-regulated gene 113-domain-containing protein [Microdochium bolleyi]